MASVIVTQDPSYPCTPLRPPDPPILGGGGEERGERGEGHFCLLGLASPAPPPQSWGEAEGAPAAVQGFFDLEPPGIVDIGKSEGEKGRTLRLYC
jgi:hypothetical protein